MSSSYHSAMSQLSGGSRDSIVAGVASMLELLRGGSLDAASLRANAHANVGTAYTKLGHSEQAIAQYEAALAIHPSAMTRYNYGLILAEVGRTSESEAQYRLATALRPTGRDASAAWNNLGNMRINAGSRPEAAECYRRAILARPTNPMAYNNLANVIRDGDDDASKRAAGRAYAMAVRLRPTYLEAYRNLGNLCKERPAWRRPAVGAYRAALLLRPSGPGKSAQDGQQDDMQKVRRRPRAGRAGRAAARRSRRHAGRPAGPARGPAPRARAYAAVGARPSRLAPAQCASAPTPTRPLSLPGSSSSTWARLWRGSATTARRTRPLRSRSQTACGATRSSGRRTTCPARARGRGGTRRKCRS